MNTGVMKPSYWLCDACGRVLFHGEYRFNCTVCYNYDYCEQCAAPPNSPHPHRMVRELAYGSRQRHECDDRVDMATNIQTAIYMYFDRHCMGIRDIDKDDPSIFLESYQWTTFETIGNRAKNFGHGLRQITNPRDYLAICAANRPEWVITDFACIFQSIISVPIYTSFTDHEIAYIINNTKITVIVCDKQLLPRLVGIKSQCPSMKHIICMDPVPDTITSTSDHELPIHYMGNIEQNGSIKKYECVVTRPDDCITVIYTSGSSSFPKGAMISESAFRVTFPQWDLLSAVERITFSYRPLAWAADRYGVITTFLCGGRTGFSTGNASRLMEELALVRPTYFGASPSIWNKIYTEFRTSFALATSSYSPEAIADEEQLLLEKFSKLMPNRCKSITIGGAMVSPSVLNFMKRCFTRCTVYESYGITECGGVTSDNFVENTLQYRLESVPEMGYTLQDKPFPRGELLTKTPQMFSGYINNQEETHAAITQDGFFRTGDIVELRTSPNCLTNIHVIDRKKSFFKLAQGQFVSPEFLQNIYIQSLFVEQIYIHGDLLADSVSAVIVPNRKYTQAYVLEHHLENFDMNNPHPQFMDAVRQDLRSIAEKESLRKHEIPSRIIIDFEPFTSQNGLLTSSMKLCRPKLAAHYADRLKTSDNIEQRLKTIIETVTGRSISTDNKDENVLLTVGGDSLAAVRLSRMIENDLGIPLSSNLLFDPKMNLQRLTTVIQHPSQRASFSQSIRTQLFDDARLDFNVTVNQHKSTDGSPSMIFITGTTGFVGSFLLAELLTIYSSNCKCLCLVRCQSSIDNPLDRIRQNMLYYQIWKDEYEHRIIPLRGDLSQFHFGLDDQTYQSLAHEIDVIFHCGASVNFIFSYSQLYGSNVYGTREIIRLATHIPSSCIPIQYISTTSVLTDDIEKETSIDETSADRLIGGYAQSKWVAEKLIGEAGRCGLRVVIYRLGLICADRRTGACNRHDLYTLLFCRIMKMRCYPKTIIGCRFNGLPVDFTVKSIVYLSTRIGSVYGNIYHVMNEKNGRTLEDVINGIRNIGIELKDVSYEEWKTKMKIMNDEDTVVESVVKLFSESRFREQSSLSCEQYRQAISTFDFPSLDQEYISKWLSFILNNLVGR